MKALALLSGGLDSTLAVRVLLEQNIEVEAINFTSPFCLCSGRNTGCSAAATAASGLGIRLYHETCGQEYLDMIANPKYGYGRNMNPCLDCRIFKLRRAKEWMERIGASFLVTGEVLNQRPMSQRRDTLDICERDADLRGMILRPLSAKVLRPTIPEERGWVDRNRLLAFSGRGRQPQIALAEELGVMDYPCPSGGCLLTYAEFAAKIRDVLKYAKRLTSWDCAMLRVGRHFRLDGGTKLVVGKSLEENERLLQLAREGCMVLDSSPLPGPIALAFGPLTPSDMSTAAAIVARYADRPFSGQWPILCRPHSESIGRIHEVEPLTPAEIAVLMVGGPPNELRLNA